MKYIVVTGGVISGLGKGITISSIGRILKSSGVRVTSIKIDPYLNVDAGLMSPFEHGETYVLDDGGETDLDLGNYERFLDITLTGRHNITSGKAYQEVIQKERRGDFLGKTVQMVPHVTDAIQSWIEDVAKIPVDGSGREPEVCLVEVGGTVGDIESMVFLEALRQFQFKVGRENVLLIHVSLVPAVGGAEEQKTKPTQHSVKELRSLGLFPDIVVCRSSSLLSESTKGKLSIFCQVALDHVISVHDVSNIYHVPLILVQQNIHKLIKNTLNIASMLDEPQLANWATIARTVDSFKNKVDIAIVGKYNGSSDTYLSVLKSLLHCGIHLNVEVVIKWVDSTDLEEDSKLHHSGKHAKAWKAIQMAHGVVVPGGFGNRGIEGKILAVEYCRVHKKPMLGLCLGMQVLVIEYCRNVLHLEQANSTEFDATTKNPVILFMPEVNPLVMGGTMRLGARATHVFATNKQGEKTVASQVYGTNDGNNNTVLERHRHRYEVNPELVASIEEKGLFFSGKDDSGVRMEIAELPSSQHPYFIGSQFHPEFKSRPNRPSPLFFGLIAIASGQATEWKKGGELWWKHEEGTSPAIKTGALQPQQLQPQQPSGSPTPYRKRSLSLSSSPTKANDSNGQSLFSDNSDKLQKLSQLPTSTTSNISKISGVSSWTEQK